MRIVAVATSALIALGVSTMAAPTAQAADFCASKISGPTYYQKNFSSGGSVVATICAPISSNAGTAYLYARGSYANVQKYMKLTVETVNKGTVTVDGQYYSYVYTSRPTGLHNYHAVMYDGAGHKIVDGWGYDYN
jgi:hypothetical protein